ncbi:bifunctional diguanylate cyclase/phosphodiesterase [Methylogaea oryzae]|nr:EAL domain-containing protein [Methylogaea oryzae]
MMSSSRRGTAAVKWLGLALAYALFARLLLTFSTVNGNVTIFWPPGGLALAALLAWGWGFWPAVFAGAVSAGLLVGDSPAISIFLAVGNTLETLVAFWLLRNRLRFDTEFETPQDFLSMTLAGGLASAISALIGLVTLHVSGYLSPSDLPDTFKHWWQGDFLGILLGTPLFLIWMNWPGNWRQPARFVQVLLFFSLSFLVGQIIFLDWFHDLFGNIALGYWMFLVVVIATVYFGRHGALLVLSQTAVQALLGASLGVGFFRNDVAHTGLQNCWFYLLVLTVTGIALALTIKGRKGAEAALLRREAYLYALVEGTTDAVFVKDRSGHYLLCNQTTEKFLGKGREQIIGFDDKKLFSSDEARRIQAEDRWVMEGGMVKTYEGEVTSADGVLRTFLSTKGPICDETGNVIGVFGIARDITERKRAEEKVRISEERLRISQTYGGVGVWVSDLLTGGQHWSDSVYSILGFPQVQKPCWEAFINAVLPEDRERIVDVYQAHLRGGVPYEVEYRITTQDGKLRWMRSAGQVERDCNGVPARMCGIVQDITDRKTAEELALQKQQLFKLFIDYAPAALAMFDRDMRYLAVSRRWLEDYRLGEQSILGRSHYEVFPEIPERWKEIHARCMEGEVIRCESDPFARLSGDIQWLRWEVRPWWKGEAVGGIVILTEDISQHKQAEDAQRLAQQVYEHSAESILVTEADGTIVSVNPAFTRITGYAAVDVLGKNPSILSSGQHPPGFYHAMWESIQTTGMWEGEIWNRRKNGELYVERLAISTIFLSDGTPWKRIGLFFDITQQKSNEDLLWKQANLDLLTGLPNRRLFRDRLMLEMRKSQRAGVPLGLLFLDLDRFKEVNETLGHDVGDALLKEAALRLTSCVRETDTVARLGGDEFTVILAQLEGLETLDRICRDILERLGQPYALGSETAYVSVSIGITLYPDDSGEIEQLVKNAEQAMYAAKAQGKNRFCYFTSVLQEAAEQRMHLANELRFALSKQQMEVHYQPIVELATGAIYKAEALIRWKHPEEGYIPPSRFIPIAEDTGLIHDLGEWVFREAVNQVKRWRDSLCPRFQISVNKSPVQFRDTNPSRHQWNAYLQNLNLPGESLVVEITEGMLLDAQQSIQQKLLGFRDGGVQVAIDDFGTGYSALSYLKKFDIDYLKIDQSFVKNLTPDSSDLALCEAIVVMAHKLGLKVIAEGVETEQQRDLLLTIGCDYGQGYLFARPMPAGEFENLLVGPG